VFGLTLFLLAAMPIPQDPGLTARVKKHYSQGAELFRDGNLQAAERELDQVIALAPGIPEPYYLQAKISAAKNRLDRAEELLQTAIRLKPDFVEAHHTLGIVLLQQKRYQLALNSLERATRLRPDYALAHLNMGNAYLGLGRSDRAIESFERALRTQSQEPSTTFLANLKLGMTYYGLKDYARAQIHLEKANALNPQSRELLLALADTYYKMQKAEAAAPHVEQLRRMAEAEPALRVPLGLLLAENGLFAEAAQELVAGKASIPPSFDLMYGLGSVYYHLDRRREAAEALAEAARLKPDEARPHCLLGQIYSEQGELEAIDALYRCVERDPTRDGAWESLAQAVFQLQPSMRSIEIFRPFAQRFPEKPLAHILLGEAFMHNNLMSEALAEFDRVLQLAPRSARALASKGFVLKQLGQPEVAKKVLREALDYDRESLLANLYLADLLGHGEDVPGALALLERIVQSNPNFAEAYVLRGQIYLRSKRLDEAVRDLEKATELRSARSRPHYILGRAYLQQGRKDKGEEELRKFELLKAKESAWEK